MKIINHYSVLALVVFLLAGGGCIVVRRGSNIRDWLLLGAATLLFATLWLTFRPVAKASAASPGKPCLLELQSPYCLACVAVKPLMDRLEKDLSDRLVVRRVNIQSEEGDKLVKEYDIEFTPTFIFLDAGGKEQWRSVGRLDEAQLRRSLQ